MAIAAAAAMILVLPAQAGVASHGFKTAVPAMLDLGPDAPAGSSITPIISSGDDIGSFTFEGIPDGIGWVDNGDGTVDVYVTHEQSRVPFPVQTPTAAGLRDFVDASISRLTIDVDELEVVDQEVALSPAEGFIRFCSAFMAGAAEGFTSPVFFANEESDDDLAVPPGAQYGGDPFFLPERKREAGYAVALDVETGKFTPISGMGRHNHENTVVVPGGWDGTVALSGDDTFNAPSSQLYLYAADSPKDLLKDRGGLFAFRVTATDDGPIDAEDPFNEANDYGDITDGDDWEGEFIPVPQRVAEGRLRTAAPQAGLEQWSNENNVFQFIRVEDLAYDRNDPNVVYFADTGERRARPDLDPSDLDAPDGRLDRAPSGFNGPYPNGRIFRMELDPTDPLAVTSFSILLNADAGGPGGTAGAMHQPDNVDTSAGSLMVQEDSSQPPRSRIFRYDFATETWSVVASVNGPPTATQAAWESSGIVDSSDVFGDGAWLVTVQAHSVFVDQSAPPAPGTTIDKREGGQLLLVRLPGT
jgi:hypothetical protein